MIDPQKRRLFRAWADSTPELDKDRGRDRFLAEHRRGRAPRPRPRRRALWLLAAAAALIAVALVVALRAPAPLSFTTASGRGKVGAWLSTGSSAELPLSFSEGTRVVLERDSRGRVEQVGRAGAHFLLERGAFHADVVHRDDTDWRFRAGPFDVQVTGTSLGAAWDARAERLTVTVDEGSVVVHGPFLGASQRVRAGERCVVDVPTESVQLTTASPPPTPVEPAPKVPSAEPAPVEAPPSATVPAPSGSPHLAPAPPLPPSWGALEKRGDYDGAYAAAERAGLPGLYAKAAADDLLRLSQVGHLSGHREVERDALLACRRRFPSTPEAALAAYQLGRASDPAEAVTWFDAYLRELPDGSLAREAGGRLLEAHALAGNTAAAREAAKRYLARHPDGPHAPLARRVLAKDP